MSLWTGSGVFSPSRTALLLQSFAVAAASRAFDRVELVTDERGMMIASRMEWEYSSFAKALDHLPHEGAGHVWMQGKLEAQLIQSEPYLHIDNDFIVLSLDKTKIQAEVLTQSIDTPGYYGTPNSKELHRIAGIEEYAVGYNAGIIGGNRLSFLRDYCAAALEMAKRIGPLHPNGTSASIICEQSLLWKMARDRRQKISTLLPVPRVCEPEDFADNTKIIHFWGRSKKDRDHVVAGERKFEQLFPEEYSTFLRNYALMLRRGTACE